MVCFYGIYLNKINLNFYLKILLLVSYETPKKTNKNTYVFYIKHVHVLINSLT